MLTKPDQTHRPQCSSSLARRRAFTLVELLVVIGIIALLISILLPALNKARRAAKTTQCLSNIRQMTMGAIQYWNDNKGKFSPYYDFGGIPPAPFQIEWFQQFTKPEQFNKCRLCPETTGPNPSYQPGNLTGTNSGNNMPGAAFYYYGPGGRVMRYFDDKGNVQHLTGAYMFNGYLLRSDPSGDDSTLAKGGQAGSLERLWIPPVKEPTLVPVVCDGTWPTGWPKESDNITGVSDLYAPAGIGALNIGNNWRRCLIARHYMAINVGFVDGHASTVPLPDLWRLHWHRNWVVPDDNAARNGNANSMNEIRAYIKNHYKG